VSEELPEECLKRGWGGAIDEECVACSAGCEAILKQAMQARSWLVAMAAMVLAPAMPGCGCLLSEAGQVTPARPNR